jgi:hypothetical protein
MAKFDFRQGLEQEKIVYKNENWDWRSFLKYIGYLLFTWAMVVAWFALFQFAFINHPVISVWVYGFCWLVFVLITASIIIANLIKHKREKNRRKREAEKVEAVIEMQNVEPLNEEERERSNALNNYQPIISSA